MDKPKGIFQQAQKVKKPTLGLSRTHALDNEKTSKQLERARGMAHLHPDRVREELDLERAVIVARVFVIYREALKWLKLTAVDMRGKRVAEGDRRWIAAPESVEAELRQMKRKVDQDLEATTDTPGSVFALLDKCEPLVAQLRP